MSTKSKRITLATIKAAANAKGLLFECYEMGRHTNVNIDCPLGMCIEPGLHHLHTDWHTGESDWKRNELADLLQRIESCQPSNCDDPECDWCNNSGDGE